MCQCADDIVLRKMQEVQYLFHEVIDVKCCEISRRNDIQRRHQHSF